MFFAELLDVYRAAILQIQQHMQHHPSLTLAGLQHLLLDCQVSQAAMSLYSVLGNNAFHCNQQPHLCIDMLLQVLLPPVHHLVCDIQQNNISGSSLLSLLHVKVNSGTADASLTLTVHICLHKISAHTGILQAHQHAPVMTDAPRQLVWCCSYCSLSVLCSCVESCTDNQPPAEQLSSSVWGLLASCKHEAAID